MRTKNSLKNIVSVFIFNLIVGILGFIKVRVFVNGLSDDIYSLNQLFYQIFSYIAIADIGFGLILNKHLYKAFAKNDLDEATKIYSTSKKFYKNIGLLMLGIALVVSFFIQFFTKANVSTFYMQIIFILFIIRNVVDYFFIAPRFVLEANQQLYKINHLVKGIKITETIIEIILVMIGIDYLLILLPGIFLTIIIDMYINKKIFKLYPWLKNTNNYNKAYLKGTKDVVYQKIAGLLNSNTDIILISTFINPISVIIYTSYSYITKYITDTVYIISYSITPSYANVLNKDDNGKTFSVFTELNSLFLFLASFTTIMLYGFLNSLIVFWVGEKYVVNNFTLLLFCFISFQIIAEKAINIIINGKGLFKETKNATIIEALLNFLISITLVNFVGIAGVLIGTIISKILTTFIMRPIYIYKNIFNHSIYKYFLNYIFVLLITIAFIIIFNIINISFTNIFEWFIYVIIFSIVIGLSLFLIFYISFKSFRLMIKRGIEFIKVRGKYTE